MPLKRAYIFNTGCIRRALDSTRIYNYLIANGWAFTNNIVSAEIVVISTCGAVNKTEDLSLIALRNAARKKAPSARLIVTGCLPKIDPDKIREIPHLGAYEFVPTGELDKLDDVLESSVRFEQIPDVNMPSKEAGLLDYILAYRLFRHSFFLSLYKRLSTHGGFLKGAVRLSEGLNSTKRKLGLKARDDIVPYYNIRIAEGCAFKCSYCSIKFATGNIHSKPVSEIMDEFRVGLAQGHKMIQLVCEDTGCYGIDIDTSMPELLRNMLAVEGDYQLILIDFGGYWLAKYLDELLPLFEAHPGKIRELYVSLQSGSDRILKAMRRPERSASVHSALQEVKRRLPHLKLRTTIIIGFPGEAEEDFKKTVDLIRDIEFDAVELNRYEDRPGTHASKMTNKVPVDVIEQRHEHISRYC